MMRAGKATSQVHALPPLGDNVAWMAYMKKERARAAELIASVTAQQLETPSATPLHWDDQNKTSVTPSGTPERTPPLRLSREQQQRLRAELYQDSRGLWHDDRGR
eukprot:CAMPEP_0174849578 /NCGR_PEP_ID=MMETSP1114-20130205/16645_1 /TAXON_ID=312471 /ORGANISM="Neobodo designis, Strain CCAP 1951/1" /LENGTH=104 /DNA_ID=CAMNT_0016083949 /DNA_START=65 /DNA_END=376 /DNA_ORIENTATION=+